LTSYFAGVVWCALVAAVAEYRYFGELFFLLKSWLFFSPSKELRTRAKRTLPLLVHDGWVTAGIFSGCLVRFSADFSHICLFPISLVLFVPYFSGLFYLEIDLLVVCD
jgi:hypothetical protein